MRALHEAVADGALGRVALILAEGIYHRPQSYYDSAAWRGTVALDGGVLMNQAIHIVDLVRWIGGPVESRRRPRRDADPRMEAEDIGDRLLRFADGALGSRSSPRRRPTTRPRGAADPRRRGAMSASSATAAEWDVPDRPAAAGPGRTGPAARRTGAGATATWGTTASRLRPPVRATSSRPSGPAGRRP